MPRLPEKIGKYRVTGRIGRGGMSVLYTAVHPTLETPVVLKKLTLKGDPSYRDRFRREAALMMKLRHENVVGVFDHFREGGGHYLVMELVDGRPLSELLAREGALPPGEVVWLAGRIASALAHIHENGVVHRDVKPSNILLDKDGTVKLSDFGIAFAPGGTEDITAEGSALGTPTFMAPEQLVDSRSADERADVWSLGVCAFELLTGRKFVGGPTPAAIRGVLPEAVRTMPGRLPPQLPSALRRLLRKSLKMRPESRAGDGKAVLRILGGAAGGREMPADLRRRLDRLLESLEPIDATKTKQRPAGEIRPAGNDDSKTGGDRPHPERMSPESQESPEQPGTSKPDQSAKVGKPISRKAWRMRETRKTREQKSPRQEHSSVEDGSMLYRLFHGRFRFSKPIAAAAVLAAGLLVLVPGVWERTFRSQTYGAMRLELSLPAETPEEWGEAAGARLYRETAEGLEDLGTVGLRPRNDGGLAGRVMYYPQGAYRIRWNLGDSVVWTSLHLPSLAGLKLRNLRFLSVRERLGNPPVFPLSLKWKVRSALNNRDLTNFAVMKWERLDQPGGSLESGGRYRITFSVPGFSDTVFPVTVDPWRRELRLDAVIWPLPGRLRIINSSGRTILPRLNHKNVYLEQTPTPHTQRSIRLPAGEERLLTVLPGGYFLTPGLGRESELFLRVPSNSLKTVVVTQNVDRILHLEVTESSP